MNRRALRLLIVAACIASSSASLRSEEPPPLLYTVPEFSLTERSGRTVRDADLRGKIWIASFVFTRCEYGCDDITQTMHKLQQDFAQYPDVLLITFTVDPQHDDVDELRRYAEKYGADANRWLFLTGPEKDVYRLLRNGFRITAEQNQGAERTPGNEVRHDNKLVLVDRDGRIRGYYEGRLATSLPGEAKDDAKKRFKESQQQLRINVAALAKGEVTPDRFNFPAFNATLNALAAALLLFGYSAVRQRLLKLHAGLMLSALAVSTVFLASYLYFHIVIRKGEATKFEQQARGAPASMKYLYYGILISHTILAVVAAPLALYTAYQGLRGRLDRHRRIAHWTLPIWLYVSLTGVVVYWMLYRLYAP